MSWRTVVISSNAKLDYQMGYLVVRRDDIKKVYIDEISILIIENTAVSLTAALLSALTKKKVKVIFCDEKRNPSSDVVQELYDQTGGEAGTFVLSEGEILYEIGKAAELIINPYAVDFNNRKFMKKIYSDLCDISITEKAMQLKIALTEMQAFIDKLCFDYPIALGCATEIKVGDLLKLYNVSVDARADNMAERLTNYIQLSSRLLGTKVFVLVNLRSYLMDSVILKIHETVQYENVALLLVESRFSADSSNMSVVIIDKDRCVINLKAPEKTLTPDQGDGFGEDLIF